MQGAPEAKDGKAKRSSPRCAWVDDPFTDELCSNFSLLALPQVFRVGISAFRRILWLLIFVAGFIASVVFTVKLVQDFLEYESATSVSIEGVDADGMIFPAVTVWNINPVRAGEVNGSTEIYESVCSLKPNINDEVVFSRQALPPDWTLPWWKSAAHQLSEMLLECEFNGVPCSVKDFDVALTPFPHVRWGIGYTFNFHSTVKTTRIASRGGLHMVLDTQVEQYCPRTWGNGFRVQFHDHGDLPTTDIASSHIEPDLGVTVSPGSRWSFATRRIEHHSLGEPYGPPCIDLRGGDEYPDPLAGFVCVKANCPDSDPNDITDVNLLSNEDPCVRDCFAARTFRFCDAATFEYDLGVEKLDLHVTEDELLTEEDLDILRNSTLVGRFVNENTTVNDAKSIQRYLSRNIVVLDVFYKELLFENRVEVPQTSIWTLFAEIGGIVGLFLGASLVTVYEAFEISSILCCGYLDRSNRYAGSDLVEKYAVRRNKHGLDV